MPTTPPPPSSPPHIGSVINTSQSNPRQLEVSAGDVLDIRGTNLRDVQRVELGGVALAVMHNVRTQILARVPSPAPSGKVRVVTASGEFTSPREFTVAANPGAGNGNGSSPGGSSPPPPPRSPSQAGADAATAYNAAYEAAGSAASDAFNAAGGDAGGTAAHVAAQNAAQAAAKQAAGTGQEATARRAAGAAYTDFKTKQLGANNGPTPNAGINAQGGASGGEDGAHSQGLHQLIHTLNQWMAVLPEPLRILAGAAHGILQAAHGMNAGFPNSRGTLGGLWSTFQHSMNTASKDAFDKTKGDGGAYGPHEATRWQKRLQGVSEWAGKGIGQFAGKMGLVDGEGMVPPAMATAIAGGVAALVVGSLNNIKGAYAAGQGASESYTNGLRSGFGAIEGAARDVSNRIISQLMRPFGASGGAVAGLAGQVTGSMGGMAGELAGLGADVRKTMTGALVGAGTLLVGVVGAGIGAAFLGPVGAAIGAFIATGFGLLFGKALGIVADFVGKGFEFIGKAAGELFKIGGEAVQAFVSVLTDCTQAASEWAHTARSVANRSGMSDGSAAGISWGLQGLGLSSGDVRGMFGGAGNGQFNRALTSAAWGVQGMPVSGDFDPYAHLSSVYERAQSLKKNMGPLGAEFQQSFLNSTGNGAMLDAVNLSPTAFYERMNFSKQFDPSAGDGGKKVGQFEDDFGTLQSEWGTFVKWLKVSFGAELLPTLKEMFGGVVGWVKANQGGIIQTLKDTAAWIYRYVPDLVLGGLRVLVVGVSTVAGVLGAVMNGIGSNLPAILKGVEALVNGFRQLIAMGMGFAAVANAVAHGGWKELLHAGTTYATGRDGALKNMKEFRTTDYLPLDQQKNFADFLKGTGKTLTGFQGSVNGTAPDGAITDNLVRKIDAVTAQFNPANRDLTSAQANEATLQQIAQNTAHLSKLGTPEEMGASVGGVLADALTLVEYVSRRNIARDTYYNARRA